MSLLGFEKPERLCIVDRNGTIVRLNDRNRTELRFDACDRARARRVLDRLNFQYGAGIASRGPYQLIPLIEQVTRSDYHIRNLTAALEANDADATN